MADDALLRMRMREKEAEARRLEEEKRRREEEAEEARREAEEEAKRQEAEEARREAEARRQEEAAARTEEARRRLQEASKPQEGELGSFERRPVRPVDEGDANADMAALESLARPRTPVPARVPPGQAFSRARRDQFPPGLDAALREQGNTDSTIQSAPFSEPIPNVLGTPPSRPQAGRPMQEGAAPVERAPRVPRGVTLMTPEQEQAQLERFGLQNPWASEPQTPAAPPRTPNVNMEIGDITTTPTARVLEDEITTTPTPPSPNLVQEQVQLDREQRQPVLGELERRPVLPVAEGDMRQRELDRIQQRAAIVSNAATPQPQLPENRTPTSGTTAPMGETPPTGNATPVVAGEGLVGTPASAPTGGSLSSAPAGTSNTPTGAPAPAPAPETLPATAPTIPREPTPRLANSALELEPGEIEPALARRQPVVQALQEEIQSLTTQPGTQLSAEEELAAAQKRERVFRILRGILGVGAGIAVGVRGARGRDVTPMIPIIRGLGGALGQAQPVEDTRARLAGRQMDERTATQARELDLNALRLAAQERYQQMMLDSRAADRDVRSAAAESLTAYRNAQTEVARERIEREEGLDDPNSPISQQIQRETLNILSLVPEQDRLSEEQVMSMSGKRLEALYGQFIRRFGHRGRGTTGSGPGSSTGSAAVSPRDRDTSDTELIAVAQGMGIRPIFTANGKLDRRAMEDAITEQRQLGNNGDGTWTLNRSYNLRSDIDRDPTVRNRQISNVNEVVAQYRAGIDTLREMEEIGRELGLDDESWIGRGQAAIVGYLNNSFGGLSERMAGIVSDVKNIGVINPSEQPSVDQTIPSTNSWRNIASREQFDRVLEQWRRALRIQTRAKLLGNEVLEEDVSRFISFGGTTTPSSSDRQWVVRDSSGTIRGRRNSPPTAEETERLTERGYTVEEAQ